MYLRVRCSLNVVVVSGSSACCSKSSFLIRCSVQAVNLHTSANMFSARQLIEEELAKRETRLVPQRGVPKVPILLVGGSSGITTTIYRLELCH